MGAISLDYSGGSLHEAFAPGLSEMEKVFATEGEVDPDTAAAQRNTVVHLFNVGILGAHVTKQVDESIESSSTHDRSDRPVGDFGRAVNDPGPATEAEIDHDTHEEKVRLPVRKIVIGLSSACSPASTGKQ